MFVLAEFFAFRFARRVNTPPGKVVIATRKVTTLAGSPGVVGSDDGIGATASFNNPANVAHDGAGNLFVSDTNNSTIRKVVVATGEVTTVVGSPGHTAVKPWPLPAELGFPGGLTVGPDGSLFVLDENSVLVVR
jgi:hypothetical protein